MLFFSSLAEFKIYKVKLRIFNMEILKKFMNLNKANNFIRKIQIIISDSLLGHKKPMKNKFCSAKFHLF